MDILAKAQQLESQGHDVIHLEVGEPDFDTPESVKAAARQAIDQGKTFYTPATGLAELREAISGYYHKQLDAVVEAKNIVITPGASGALQLALSAIVDPGDMVLMAEPGYPCNRHFVHLLDGVTKSIQVDEQSQFQITHQHIKAHWEQQTVAVLIASPSNPTGTLIDKNEMQQIIKQVELNNGALIVDEIYQGLVYESRNFTAASLSQNVFIVNSFSKYFNMTGWRLGWLVVPDDYITVVDRLAQNLFLAAPTISQYAALAAFSNRNLSELSCRKDELKQRRDFLLQGLTSLGFNVKVKPGGAFYIYADVSSFTDNSFKFCQRLLNDAHVAITPGKDFGDFQSERYVRFAYTQSIEKLQQALDRISRFLLTC